MTRSDTLGIMAAIIMAQRERTGGVEAWGRCGEYAVASAAALLDLVEAGESARLQAAQDACFNEMREDVTRREGKVSR